MTHWDAPSLGCTPSTSPSLFTSLHGAHRPAGGQVLAAQQLRSHVFYIHHPNVQKWPFGVALLFLCHVILIQRDHGWRKRAPLTEMLFHWVSSFKEVPLYLHYQIVPSSISAGQLLWWKFTYTMLRLNLFVVWKKLLKNNSIRCVLGLHPGGEFKGWFWREPLLLFLIQVTKATEEEAKALSQLSAE